ncbi:MAG: cytochrome c biogenesis protein CcdA [Thermoleophilia bacterium]|nr:cytochrome c biogenesis protein CcdA [Thermoleophilia bacterium]
MLSLIIPTFFAGVLTFLAPCTLPLVPAYIGFISGVSVQDLADPKKRTGARRKVLINGMLYVLGFSAVFIFFGILFGLGGAALIHYRHILQRVGGVLVIFFGLFMLKVFHLPGFNFLMSEKKFHIAQILTPGRPLNSFLFGAVFAFVLVASGVVFYGLKAAVGIRLTPEQELMGSDFAEHGMWGYPEHFVGPDDGSDGTTIADRLREPVMPSVASKPTPAGT